MLAVFRRGKTSLGLFASSHVVKGSFFSFSVYTFVFLCDFICDLQKKKLCSSSSLFLPTDLFSVFLVFANPIFSCLLSLFFSLLPLSWILLSSCHCPLFPGSVKPDRDPRCCLLKAHRAPTFRTVTTSSRHLSQLCQEYFGGGAGRPGWMGLAGVKCPQSVQGLEQRGGEPKLTEWRGKRRIEKQW